jgi:hypothetical protein
MTAPERIWAVHHETHGAVMIGEWADTIRHLGGVEYVRADLHDATKAQLAKAWETCFAATNRGMIVERKLAKAVEALRKMAEGASNNCESEARAVLAEIEKGGV